MRQKNVSMTDVFININSMPNQHRTGANEHWTINKNVEKIIVTKSKSMRIKIITAYVSKKL